MKWNDSSIANILLFLNIIILTHDEAKNNTENVNKGEGKSSQVQAGNRSLH